MFELGETNGKKCPLVAKNIKIFKNGVRKSSPNAVVAQPKELGLDLLFTFLKAVQKNSSETLQRR